MIANAGLAQGAAGVRGRRPDEEAVDFLTAPAPGSGRGAKSKPPGVVAESGVALTLADIVEDVPLAQPPAARGDSAIDLVVRTMGAHRATLRDAMRIVDVFPDGRAIFLTDGILRARYRHSLAEPELLAPGQVYEITLDLSVTSNVFLPGHRIRLEVSSSNFPRFDRNLNTGGNNYSNNLYIRGIGSGQNASFDQSVAMFMDDIYHGRSRMSDATFLDLDRIEVLKGPQSTFFGNSAIAGADDAA